MKQLLALLLFLPFVGLAQKEDDPNEKRNDGELILVHADRTFKQPAVRKENSKKNLKDDDVYVGNVVFKIGSTQIACDSAISYTNEKSMLAFHVKITNPLYFTITGGMLNYGKDNNFAFLTDDITVTALNGELVGYSKDMKIDFSYEVEHVINAAISRNKKQ